MTTTTATALSSGFFHVDGTPVLKVRAVISETRDSVTIQTICTCPRCGGTGKVYSGLDNSRCWGCGATGKVYGKVRAYREEQLPKAQARKAKADDRKAAKAKAETDAANQRLTAAIEQHGLKMIMIAVRMAEAARQNATHGTSYRLNKAINARDAFEKFARQGREELTAQWAGWLKESWQSYLELANKINDDDAAKAAARENPKEWIHPGRYEISGEVTSVTEKSTPFGFQTKAIVRDGVRTYWVSVPGNPHYSDVPKGRVTFTATVERSDRDPLFGFCKRPVKWTEVDPRQ